MQEWKHNLRWQWQMNLPMAETYRRKQDIWPRLILHNQGVYIY